MLDASDDPGGRAPAGGRIGPGTFLAERFRLEAHVGSGGMGTVFRAVDQVSGERVAVKLLLGTGRTALERFEREARILSELRHPGIVRFVAQGALADGGVYLAMELLLGEDLAARLARAPLAPDEAVAIVRRTAEALAAAHALGVVHRDVKPSNIFLPAGTPFAVKLLDFGIARLLGDGGALTATGTMLGTPAYMAPEQARGDRQLDPRVDVYGLGCVLYECLVGTPPFGGAHAMGILAKVLLEEPPALAEKLPGLPRALASLVDRMLQKDADARPRDAREVARALDGIAALGDLQALRPPAPLVALSTDELQLMTVVFLGPAQRAGAAPDHVPRVEIPSPVPSEATEIEPTLSHPQSAGWLEVLAGGHGARCVHLLDGSVVLALSGRGLATDQASRAARLALAVRGERTEGAIVIATGRGVLAARVAVGDAIDRAAQLHADLAQEDASIVLDDVTAGLLDARFDVEHVDGGYRLRSEREATGARRLLGRVTPCLGRDRELGTLGAILGECAEQSCARVALVTAPAGAGKSRLQAELLRRHAGGSDGEGVRAWIARGDPLTAGAPLGLLVGLLHHAFGLRDASGDDERRATLETGVARRVPAPDRDRVTEFLGELAGVRTPGDAASAALRAARQNPIMMGDQLRRAWQDLVVAECRAGPLLIVLEDLHWGDRATVEFLDAALRHAADLPLFVLAFARPEVHELFPGLWAERDLLEIRLPPLGRRACEKLIRTVLGEVDDETTSHLVARSGGNAFFLEELIRATAEGRTGELPSTMVAMVQARLERLETDARLVLRAASLYGDSFSTEGLAALLGGSDAPRTDLLAWLPELSARELLTRRASSGAHGDEFAFRHDLLREAAYSMLTERDRRVGHGLAGAWLERTGAAEPHELAVHFERAGEASRAAGHFARAAEQALEANDYTGAIARAERGETCDAEGRLRGTLARLRATAHRWRGDHREAVRFATRALEWLPRGSIDWYAAAMDCAMACAALDDTETLIESARRLLESVSAAEALDFEVMALVFHSSLLRHVGEMGLFGRVVRRIDELRGTGVALGPGAESQLHYLDAVDALLTGHPEGFLEHIEQCIALLDRAGDLRTAAINRHNAGYALVQLGDDLAAVERLRDAIEIELRLNLPDQAAQARSNLVVPLLRLGEIAEAEACARSALLLLSDNVEHAAITLAYLSDVMLARGDVERAVNTLEEALEKQPRSTAAVPVRARLVSAYLARGAIDAARRELTLMQAQLDVGAGVEEGESLARLAIAEALHAFGDVAGARVALGGARARLLERAARIRRPAWRDTFLGIPENRRTLELARAWLDEA